MKERKDEEEKVEEEGKKERWMPACAGMTAGIADMTAVVVSMTAVVAGMEV